MQEIINRFFNEKDGLGQIRLRCKSLSSDKNLNDSEKVAIAVTGAIIELNLLSDSSTSQYIDNYRPGQSFLSMIETGVHGVSNIYIKAFFFDVLQVNQRNKYENSKLALESYWKICCDRETLSEKREFYIRMFRILTALGKGRKNILPLYFHPIKREILNADMRKDCYSITKLVEEMVPLKQESGEYISFIEQIRDSMQFFVDNNEFRHFRECNHVLALLLPELSKDYGAEVARAYILEANYKNTPNALLYTIVDLYKKALKIYQKLQINTDDTHRYRLQLIEIQKKAARQHHQFGSLAPIPLTVPEFTMPEFESFINGVHWLISLDFPPREQFYVTENEKKDFLHQLFLSSVVTDAMGNTVGTDENNAKDVYRMAAIYRDIVTKTILRPSFEMFSKKFSVSEEEVYWLISESSFIPEERLAIYAHGLYFGFCQDYGTAVHLLLPQIENGLRFLLKKNQIVTRKLTDDVQTENSLVFMLSSLKTILKQDLIFDLEGLLNEPFGNNMRNLVAHGLCEEIVLYTAPGFYTWWIALKLAIDIESYIITDHNVVKND